jgi:hypothetical protein
MHEDKMLSDLMQAIAREGWDGIDNAERDLAAAARATSAAENDEYLRQARIVRAAIDTPAGQEFMLWLLKKTLFRAPAAAENAAEQNPGAYAIAKAKRQGQNSIAFLILEALAVKLETTGGDL